MANSIQIKRSLLSAAPASLLEGEMAYVFGTDTLYIGGPSNTIINIAGASTYAKLANPIFSGLPQAPTAVAGTSTTQLATTAFATVASTAAQTAAQAYADGLVLGILKDRGNYNASTNTYPATGGSGTSGAILKGDLWTVNVAGILGGVAVTGGDLVRALVNTPGQTATNWAVSENNFGYAAENSTNKVTSISAASTDVQYASAKLIFDLFALKLGTANNLSDLADYVTARSNLGLGTMALQAASAVAITGGTINGITITGGTF